MVGGVYRIPIQGRHNNFPHPHVVILEITGSKECVIVPGFSADGEELQLYLNAITSMGYTTDQVCVEMDNSQHVRFVGGMTGKRACWLPERHRRVSVRELRISDKIGEMDAAGLSQIATAMLNLAIAKPELFSLSLIKRIRRLKGASD